MNVAPINQQDIYKWVCEEITKELKDSYSEIDFEELNTIQKLFAADLQPLRKGALSLLLPESNEYKIRLADALIELQGDWQKSTNAHIRYLCAERGKLLITVLDNCDKRNRDDQLLMFQVAQWLQKQFRCLVILPLREETFDSYKNEPPLDTASRSLIFRIEPPDFHKVIQKRVSYIIKELSKTNKRKNVSISLYDSVRTTVTPEEQRKYLEAILKALFIREGFVKSLISGIAGKNLRRAIEIFVNICKSGYISEKEIWKIRQSEGDYGLAFHVVLRILLRLDKKYYNSDTSYIKNLFQIDPNDDYPNHFTRLAI